MAMFIGGAGYKASTILVSQEVMKWLVLNSYGNVVIQTYNRPHFADPAGGATEEARLYCMKCNAFTSLELSVISNDTKLLDELQWAKGHTHNLGLSAQAEEAPIPSGERKLKVVL